MYGLMRKHSKKADNMKEMKEKIIKLKKYKGDLSICQPEIHLYNCCTHATKEPWNIVKQTIYLFFTGTLSLTF